MNNGASLADGFAEVKFKSEEGHEDQAGGIVWHVDAPVPSGVWHTLRVEFLGTRISVALNGTTYIEHEDSHIAGAGAIGVWTKADSVTAFDDFSYGSWQAPRE